MPTLRYLTQAGGAMRPDTIRWVRSAFATARLFVMYGQTEATARLSYVPPERGEEKTGSIGIAIPGVQLAVVDEHGSAIPDGEVGHLVARGDNVTPGYLEAPADTAAILHGGWLWTGDLAHRDEDGYFWVAGRRDDLLKIGGHRISVNEIENLLYEHPAVRDVAVVGIEEPIQGAIPVAFVVASMPSPELELELRRLCRDRGGVHKVPSRILFIDAIPRSPSGKALKPPLVARACTELERGR
jgi:acyl-coenzyme A synthetase/AMP-(fatty) acid ligase